MFSLPPFEELRDLIMLARREDLRDDDVTSRLLVPEETIGVGTLLQKETGVVCGLPIVEMVCRAYDERLRVELIPGFHLELIEGRFSDARTLPLLRMRGPMRRCSPPEPRHPELPAAHGRRRNAHPPLRPAASTATSRKDLRYTEDDPRPSGSSINTPSAAAAG